MTFIDQRGSPDMLKASADRALSAGDPAGAIPLFEQAAAAAPDRLDIWLGLAASRRAVGDSERSLQAIDRALNVDPRCYPALLMKGSLLESLGQPKAAATIYADALSIAPDEGGMPGPMQRATVHARELRDRYQAELVDVLRSAAGFGAGGPTTSERRRIETFIDFMTGRRKIYHSEPPRFYYPGLPSIEFFERDEFPWLADLEGRTQDIRAEAMAVWTEGSSELRPYVQYPESMPLDQWVELNHSLEWSVYDLLKDGEAIPDHCAQCPKTMAALEGLGQPKVPGRSPTALFSILRPRTRIPPHNGVTNTRLLVHLPLVIPEDCGFRVGGETRAWRVGEALVFDDTIEHEAWNGSDKPRAVMICDIWNPRVPMADREVIAALMAELDRFNGAASFEVR